MQSVQHSPLLRSLSTQLKKNPSTLTTKNVETIGEVAVKSSGIKLGYGEGMILAAGVLMLILIALGLASDSS
ncbi:hypothetical protein PHMEG_00034209 [Phytophthora megakarya]|uniref:Uncharacterized protein n=1 Tax=Phytophthora megakarya TaxID=4795 RepID=A0A225URI3_9STRA|nr:hypothetical protein PHMEG_00034209 [Phytophthora megakarya]